jgi:FKBP-type peptidyl-prolyl cis-trans isomerase SlyD
MVAGISGNIKSIPRRLGLAQDKELMMTDQPESVKDFVVVTMDYTLTVDGEVIDTSRDSEAIQFIQGQGDIVPGLEKYLYGMVVSESKKVVVSPEEGYGEVDPEAFINIMRSEFPEDLPLEIDIPLQIQTKEGDIFEARISSYTDEEIRLDLNHILAGKELHFDVEIVDLRFATPEEIAHGHVHGDEHEHGEDGHEA